MRRLPLTLTLTALTALTLTTAALAAPTGPAPGDCPMADDPGMVAMHAEPDAMLAMHDDMPDLHPQMTAHLQDAGLDADQMRAWMAAGLDHDDMHQRMAEAGVDLEAMHASCPMADHAGHGDAMPHGGQPHHDAGSVHGHGAPSDASMSDDHERHHR